MLDSYNREITYLRLSVTELCNLRCRYCMPAEGVCKKSHADMLTEDETIAAVQAAATLGIRKVRITGGEPLVKPNILSICERCASVPGINEVCLTTNAVMLPRLAGSLKSAGVKRLNISLDTLNREKYAYITRIGSLEGALAGIEAALNAGFEKIKINSVLIGGFNDDEIADLAGLTMKYPVDVRFIELMPMVDNPDFNESSYISGSAVLDVLPTLEPQVPDGGVARLFHLPGAFGNVGLISPISAHFCAECNRLRLTADGKIKPCLHSSDEYSIKGLDYDGVLAVMKQAIMNKPAWHGVLTSENPSHAGRNMNQIGG